MTLDLLDGRPQQASTNSASPELGQDPSGSHDPVDGDLPVEQVEPRHVGPDIGDAQVVLGRYRGLREYLAHQVDVRLHPGALHAVDAVEQSGDRLQIVPLEPAYVDIPVHSLHSCSACLRGSQIVSEGHTSYQDAEWVQRNRTVR